MSGDQDMASKDTKKNELNWENFRPEWANEGIERISQELEKWNDDLQARSADFRKQSQKRIDKSVAQIQQELRKLPGAKRVEEIRSDLEKRVEKRVEKGVDRVYASLKIARLDEVKKLERKISQLNKKLRDLEKQWAA
jgi:DNA repair exonuclease SbcCD ATPase subunit